MIDQKVLTTKLLLIAKHFQKDLLPEVMSVWAEYLNAELNTDEFEQAVKEVILHSRFFPTAGEFVEKIKGNKEAQAIREWQSVVTAAAGREEAIAYLSTRGKVALQAIGGLRAIALAEDRLREKLEKNFIAVHCQCSDKDARSLPPSPSPMPTVEREESAPIPDHVKAKMDDLMQKMSIKNGRGNR
jgi:hypothetical protein